MSSVVPAFTAWSVDFGLVMTRTSGTGWKYESRSPIGFKPAFSNSSARYSVVRTSPLVPGSRPSSLSLARWATADLIRSAEISPAKDAGMKGKATSSGRNLYATGISSSRVQDGEWAARIPAAEGKTGKCHEPALDRCAGDQEPVTAGSRAHDSIRRAFS